MKTEPTNSPPSVYFYDQRLTVDDRNEEILSGLTDRPRSLSPKFFYDERGSELFAEITRQPEYYLTRVETELLRRYAGEIGQLIGDDFMLIEYGSGSSEKTRILLEVCAPAFMYPWTYPEIIWFRASEALARQYPWLEVHATCVDFTDEFELPFQSDKRHVSFFPWLKHWQFRKG